MKLLIKKLAEGKVTRVGEIDFPDSAEPTLTVTAQGAIADELRAAWDAVRALPVIAMKWSEPDPQDESGDTFLIDGADVRPGTPEYPRAVADLLSRRYGFFASPAEYG